MFYTNNFEKLNIQVIDGDRGKNYPHNYELFSRGDVLFLSNKNISNDKLSLSEAQFISLDKHNEMGKGALTFNDIVITTRGTLGNVLYINHNFRLPARINSGMVIIKPNDNYIPRFLYYYFISPKFKSFIEESKSGAAQPQLPIKDLVKIKLPDILSFSTQQHIVDSIGSVDDAIEKNEEIIDKIKIYGNKLFSTIDTSKCIDANSIISFEKGVEIGSANYYDTQVENSLPYIRVGNLLNNNYDTFCINKDYKKCDYDDILIAFDGAPGRNSVGLSGVYSSGIYKVVCDNRLKGFIYFYLNSSLCQDTIKQNSQGTTILHAGKSIKLLKLPDITNKFLVDKFNNLYDVIINIYKKQIEFKHIKQLLLDKYFD